MESAGCPTLHEALAAGDAEKHPPLVEQRAIALQHYCENDDARKAAGEAGCAASERYGWDRVNQALVDGYLRIARQHEGGVSGPPRSPAP